MAAELHPGQRFSTLNDFKTALRDWSINKGYDCYRIHKSDSTRVIATCRSGSECPFRIRCNWDNRIEKAVVGKNWVDHECEGTPKEAPVKRSGVSKLAWLISAIPKIMNLTEDTPGPEIIRKLKEHYGAIVFPQQVYKAKIAILKSGTFDPNASIGDDSQLSGLGSLSPAGDRESMPLDPGLDDSIHSVASNSPLPSVLGKRQATPPTGNAPKRTAYASGPQDSPTTGATPLPTDPEARLEVITKQKAELEQENRMLRTKVAALQEAFEKATAALRVDEIEVLEMGRAAQLLDRYTTRIRERVRDVTSMTARGLADNDMGDFVAHVNSAAINSMNGRQPVQFQPWKDYYGRLGDEVLPHAPPPR